MKKILSFVPVLLLPVLAAAGLIGCTTEDAAVGAAAGLAGIWIFFSISSHYCYIAHQGGYPILEADHIMVRIHGQFTAIIGAVPGIVTSPGEIQLFTPPVINLHGHPGVVFQSNDLPAVIKAIIIRGNDLRNSDAVSI